MSVEVQHQAQLSSHKWNVSCLEFSPNGLFLASGSWDKTAVIWNLCTLEPSLTFRHHTEPVTSLSWQKLTSKSELGILATTSSDKTVALWNSDNGNLLNNLTHHSSWVLGSDFNNDGKLLASASWDKFVIISDVPTGKPVNTLAGHTTGVWTCAFNPERTGDILCSGADDGSLKLWDIRSNSVVMSLVGGHDDRVKSCAWSPNGEYVASSSADGRVTLWEPRLGTALSKIRAHEDAVTHVEFYPFVSTNSVPVLFTSGGRACRVWHPFRKRKQLESIKPHKAGDEVEAFSISPDGTLLATGGSDRNIVLSALEISLDEVDALPIDSPEKNINHGTMLWKKYARKIIEHTMAIDSKSVIPDLDGSSVSQNTAILVEKAVHRQENPKKIEKATTPTATPARGDKLTAEPEVILQQQIRKLRPGSMLEPGGQETLSNEPTRHVPPPSPFLNRQLKEARQQLRKVSKTSSTGSGESRNSSETNGLDGVVTNTSKQANGFHSDSDDGVTIAVENSFSTNRSPPLINGRFSRRDHKAVKVQSSALHRDFSIGEGQGSYRRASNASSGSDPIGTIVTVDDESGGSVSSSSYYADIDDQENEFARRFQTVHRF